MLYWFPLTGGLWSWILFDFALAVRSFLAQMWWGIVIGVVALGFLEKIPQDLLYHYFGKTGFKAVSKAAVAGVLLDMCNHGILMIAANLYKRGATIGSVVAFLVASPWNSFSLTIILWSLVGFWWTAGFIVLSLVIAIASGLAFDALVGKKVLPANPNSLKKSADFTFSTWRKQAWNDFRFSFRWLFDLLWKGIKDSRMILRWLLFGIIVAALIRTFVPHELFTVAFGVTLMGLFLTIVFTTVIEVCSEGSVPIAADIFLRASAPGNAFAFLMGGVATDYTEILVMKQATASWKIALFLPLIILPQAFVMAWIINYFSI